MHIPALALRVRVYVVILYTLGNIDGKRPKLLPKVLASSTDHPTHRVGWEVGWYPGFANPPNAYNPPDA